MANILIIPTCAHVNVAEVAQSVALALPDAKVFNPLANLERAENLIAAGKADDWLDALVGEVAEIQSQNVVIQGIPADAERVFLAAYNVALATSFNAQVIFAVSNEKGAEKHLSLAKQAFANASVNLVGVVGNEAAALLNDLPVLGKASDLNTGALAQIAEFKTDRISPAQFRFNMIDLAKKPINALFCPRAQSHAPFAQP